MSRAFVKETAEGAAPPERMVSSGPNLVTEEGLAKIAGRVERLELALAACYSGGAPKDDKFGKSCKP